MAPVSKDGAMTWTAPEITRASWPPASLVADERTLADQWLEFHRQTLLWKCSGLSSAQLKERNIAPSNISLLGLVRHMAEVERDWFRTRFAGERPGYLYVSDDDMDAEFTVEGADAESDFASFRREIDTIRNLLCGRGLDEEFRDPNRNTQMSLRWVYTIMIQEYARHNGHADLLRERIDGQTGH
jgi:uncharacterized damage-inducible protein DinB